jgi:hypothetical protein
MPVWNTTNCSITAGGSTLAGYVMDMNVQLNMSTVEVTSVGDADQFHVPGIRSGTASGNIFYNQDAAVIKSLETARTNGTEVTFVFTWHSGATYTAKALVTSFSPTVTFNEVVKAAISLQFTDAVTISA